MAGVPGVHLEDMPALSHSLSHGVLVCLPFSLEIFYTGVLTHRRDREENHGCARVVAQPHPLWVTDPQPFLSAALPIPFGWVLLELF